MSGRGGVASHTAGFHGRRNVGGLCCHSSGQPASRAPARRPKPFPETRFMAWDPAQSLKCAGPRLRPALDLLQRIDIEAPDVVYDLGAGAGNVTRLIAARWPPARLGGIDGSAE